MEILKINPKPRVDSLIWEHVTKTILGLIGFFALLIFGPLFILSGRNGGRGKESLIEGLIDFYQENPLIFLFAPIFGAIIFNLSTIIKNFKKHHIIKISQSENLNTTDIELISSYSNKPKIVSITNEGLVIKRKIIDSIIFGKSSYFELRTKSGLTIARINPDNPIYSKQQKRIDRTIEYYKKTHANTR